MRRRAGGFTLIELVMIIVIIGILAVVALPRMDTGGYRALEFHDRTVAALRYAQKTATSHRRVVCVTFPDAQTLQLTIDTNRDGGCDTALLIPGATNNRVVGSDPASAGFASLPAALNFAANGTSADVSLSLKGSSNVIIVGTTGYVQ